MIQNISRYVLLALLCVLGVVDVAQAGNTVLEDSPILATTQVPPNVLLTLSVEWPTGTVVAYSDNQNSVAGFECTGRDSGIGICYYATRTYLGYYDPAKCYAYDSVNGYFVPKAIVGIGASCATSTGRWSGNYLNWAQSHALDEFRYAMTGGDRYIDTATTTVIEKSFHSGQGGYTQFPIKRVQSTAFSGTPNVPAVPPSTVSDKTWPTMYSRVTTDDSTPLAMGTPRIGRVIQFANNPAFLNAMPATMRYIKVQLSLNQYLALAEVQVYGSSTATTWTNCATEGNTCTPSGASAYEVRFGTGTTYNTQVIISSSVPCNTSTFGDPAVGFSKSCSYRPLTANLAQGKTATQASTYAGTALASRAVDGNTDGNFNDNSVSHTNDAAVSDWWQVDLGSAQSVRAIVVWNRTDCCSDRLNGYYVMGSNNDISTVPLDTALSDSTIWKYFGSTIPSPNVVIAPDPSFIATDYMNGRVKVCDATIGLESNCTAYGAIAKPTGVIQNNADKMRFGVTAYLNVDGENTMGGVLRSGMKAVGPNTIVPNGTPADNPRKEITASGLFVTDPENLATGDIQASGVISYLNKFGKLGPKMTLKSNDTVSELFYESLRYMRGATAATPQFNNFVGTDPASQAAARDGFPVFTDWTDPLVAQPIQSACQKNYFVGIGDTNTWCDYWGPGNNRTSNCSNSGAGHNGTPPTDTQLPSIIATDNLLGANEAANGAGGLTNGATLGTTFLDTGRNDTFDVAGYAFWANTFDILPDDVSKPWTLGKQSVQFYWVDVRETNSFNGNPAPKNQYWLAGKYGGFPSSTTSTASSQEYPSSTFDPLNKNYFTGERPDTLIASLQSVFQNILALQQSNASASLSSNNLAAPGAAYLVRYNSSNWTGEVIGETASFNASDLFVGTQTWTSAALIDAQNWNTGRKIVTYNNTANAGAIFRPPGTTGGTLMNTTQFGYFGTTLGAQTDLINYLRGQTTYETGTGAKYRQRVHQLGDIVNSAPLLVSAPTDGFSDANNPGYSAFATAQSARNPVLYFGANDGMMHAIDARVDSTAGTRGAELFAYVPSLVLSGPSSPATPSVDGIASRANITFAHKYLVDGQLQGQSVDFGKTGGTTSAADWHTIVVGGLGKGGRGFYAMDVTDPTTWTSESAVAGKVLWEFTDPDMGYSYGTPLIAKTAKWGWVVIVSSGYNNTAAGQTGRGWIALLNAKTGALIQKISTGVGTVTNPAGLAKFTAFAPDRTDYTADSVYAGDLLGNLWRFDLTSPSGGYPAPTLLTTLKDGSGNVQPITASPSVGVTIDSLQRWVFVGTGKLLALSDENNSSQQSFYALRDGLQSKFATTAADGSSFPFSRSNLVALTDTGLTTGITIGVTSNGWYHDFTGTAAGGATEREVTAIDVQQGLVAFTSQTPSTDPCSPGVSSRVYVVSFATGTSYLLNSSGATVPYVSTNSADFGVDLVSDPGGKIHVLESTTTPALDEAGTMKTLFSGPLVKLNWREILNSN